MPRDGPLILTGVRGPVRSVRAARALQRRTASGAASGREADRRLVEAMSRQGWRRCYHDWRKSRFGTYCCRFRDGSCRGAIRPIEAFMAAIRNGRFTSTPVDKSLGVQVERERSERLSPVRQVQADARTETNAFLLAANERWPPHAVRMRVPDRIGRTLSISSPQRTNETPV